MKTSFYYIRKKRIFKAVAAFLALNILAEIISPSVALALTAGPSQPEVESFEPAGTSDMVDMFTGDFNYNIPLFDLPGSNGGYPFNLSYHSGISMDQEASWVGLGWNINPGAINRDKRGLPDDFNGDVVSTELDMAPNITYGVTTGASFELWGGDASASSSSSGALGMSVSIYNNSYKGIGYSLDNNFSFTNDNAAVGLGLNLDSQEGVGANADLTLGKNMTSKTKQSQSGTVGVGYNSQRGLSLSVSGNVGGKKVTSTNKKGQTGTHTKGLRMSGSSTYSFSEQAFMPAFTTPMKGFNVQTAIKMGGDLGGFFADFTIGGFYRKEEVKNINQAFNAYGYNYMESAGSDDLMDFNREKDGIIRKETPNLPSPTLTFDTYSATSQGFMGNYRAHRNDFGHLHDPFVQSEMEGGSFGVDLGFGYPFHLGLAGSFNYTKTNSGDWSTDNDFVTGPSTNYVYTDGSDINKHDYEKVYYKVKGEPSSFETNEMADIGGELAVRPNLTRHGSGVDAYYMPDETRLEPSSGPQVSTPNGRETKDRIKRDNSIQPVTNDLLLYGSAELIPEYDINYFTSMTLTGGRYTGSTNLNRITGLSGVYNHPSHNAGFTCVNPSGMRYVYALPVYNRTEKEEVYSIEADSYGTSENLNHLATVPNISDYKVPETDKFKSRTTTPAYAYSYLLTSVLGADYVDMTGDGPTDDDYGYWVKFNYLQSQTDFQWRSPYEGGMYLRGLNNRASDDKCMFTYGKKDVWYLASAETKSHIAVFKMSARKDGYEASGEFTAGMPGKTSNKLDEINLYTKSNYLNTGSTLVPLKTVYFDYTYDLCGHVPNNLGGTEGTNPYFPSPAVDRNENVGKLTLKKVWFTYQNDTRGELSPYIFDYHERDSGGATDENPNYGYDNYDRWGGYRASTDVYASKNLPYVTQFDPSQTQDASTKSGFKAIADKNAAVWTLKEITLPTGGSIEVDYESDDYGYVQHRQATQMMQISSMYDLGEPDKVYSNTSWSASTVSQRRVYFKLENPIPVGTSTSELFRQYIAGLKQADGTYPLYFRLRSELRDGKHETVSGYCNLDVNEYGYNGSDLVYVGPVQCYASGYVTLDLMSGNNSALPGTGQIEYHPFAVAAWQFMRINEPELLTAFGSLGSAAEGSSDADKAMKVASLVSVIPAALQVFTGYRRYAFNHSWGKKIDRAKSFIKLCTPDKIKLGGGLRVKRITYNDNWNSSASGETSGTYGQVYKYTIDEIVNEERITTSSGVAQYEPMIGGDEIALRHPRNFMDNIPLATDNNLYFEYPINESYYPGPSVGYSKVTVQSLGSYRTNAGNTESDHLDEHINSTGIIEYEFYTAQEYPVITDETDNQVRKANLFIPIPLMGQINMNKLFETQGYAITLNDMHGKLKAVRNYSKNVNGEKANETSSVSYKYKSAYKILDGQTVKVLDNTVEAVTGESIDQNSGSSSYHAVIADKKKVILGEEYDYFSDARQSHVFSVQGGLAGNVEFAYPYAPIPIPWPAMSENTKDLRTFVTNKVIHKAGILESTTARDGQSTVKTNNLLFDASTGTPILTQVTNDFEKPVYTYSHPARWEYEGMGIASQNFNYRFYGKVASANTNNTFRIHNDDSSTGTSLTRNPHSSSNPIPTNDELAFNTLEEGDEFIVQRNTEKWKATLIDKSFSYDASCGKAYHFTFFPEPSSVTYGDELLFTLVRSGRKNLLTSDAGSITALKDPTDKANRAYVNQTASSAPCLAAEVSAFLNYIIRFDENAIAGDQLPSGTWNLRDNSFFNNSGEPSYPLLSSIFNYISITHTTSSGVQYYTMNFSYTDEDGDCVTSSCTIGPYAVQYTPEYSMVYQISSIAAVGCNSIDISYTGVESPVRLELSCIEVDPNMKYTYIDDVISSSSILYRQFWDYDGYALTGRDHPPVGIPDQTNLYGIGKKGIWKPYRNYYYYDSRVNENLTAEVELDHDGVYKGTGTITGKNEFYLYKWNPTYNRPLHPQWLPSSLVVAYDENSNAVETKDVVNIYSAVKYGNGKQLPVIQGSNATKKELLYESFDDATSQFSALTTASIPHTGKKSYSIAGNNTLLPGTSLSLLPGKDYTISLWASQNRQDVTYAGTSQNIGATVIFYNNLGAAISNTGLIQPSGNVIEKWQRIESAFTVPLGTVTIGIKLEGVSTTYFDDLRIFPSAANISTSVYDPNNFRIMSVLDANNYATFYHYDEEGKMFMVKKETTGGIKTIKEERNHIVE